MKTKLKNVDQIPRKEFEDAAEYDALLAAQIAKEDVTVTLRSVEVRGGESDYYCIELQSGRSIDGLSGAHLVNIEAFED
ncbi:hypothetical protein ABIC83_003004 [Roseateles asaccharophilus]|uniref:hypothetical protein n=1 Tax=Roseateles asaccharophilus TaxID=582607 RepID=UPI0038376C32